jgi:precorrin-6x reductase
MTKAPESQASTPSSELLEEVRESARVGQHAAAEALRKFRRTLDEVIPEAVHPLRTKIDDAAIELADTLATAQYQFNRNLIRSTDRALSASDGEEK